MAIYVNYEGLQQAASDVGIVKTKFEEAMASLTETVEGTTENDWKGPDADLFVNNTKAKITNIRNEYNEFLDELIKLINENHDAFKETQQRNISMQG